MLAYFRAVDNMRAVRKPTVATLSAWMAARGQMASSRVGRSLTIKTANDYPGSSASSSTRYSLCPLWGVPTLGLKVKGAKSWDTAVSVILHLRVAQWWKKQ